MALRTSLSLVRLRGQGPLPEVGGRQAAASSRKLLAVTSLLLYLPAGVMATRNEDLSPALCIKRLSSP